MIHARTPTTSLTQLHTGQRTNYSWITTMGYLNSWKGMKKSKEMCMEIPVIVLDHQGEVAFWSKLAAASWVALDIWPDWNSQFQARKSLTVLEILPPHSALFLPLSISWYPSTFLPSLVPILSILKGTVASTRAGNCHHEGWQLPPFSCFPHCEQRK